MKTLALDIDGVLCAHALAVCNAVNADFGTNAKPLEVRTRDHDFGPITFNEAVRRYYPSSQFIESMHCTPGAIEFVSHRGLNVHVIICTTRKDSHDATERWVRRHFGTRIDLQFVGKKAELTPDFLVDDDPCELVEAAKTGTFGFLYSQPWNENNGVDSIVVSSTLLRRVTSFQSVFEYLSNSDLAT